MFNKLTKFLMLLAMQFISITTIQSQEVMPVTQFTDLGAGTNITVAADNANNGVAVYLDAENVMASYSANGGLWNTPVMLSTDPANFSPDVAMDATGTALAIWRGSTTGISSIRTAFFSNGVWSTPTPASLDTGTFFTSPIVTMNGTGKGLAIWSQTSLAQTHVSFFSGGVWSTTQSIGIDGVIYSASYNSNGQASAIWNNQNFGTEGIYATTYNGIAWQTQTQLDNIFATGTPVIGIDNNGNSVAIWESAGNIVSSRFNGSAWSTTQTISIGTNNSQTGLAVASDGTAVAVWKDGSGNITLNLFNGTSWGTPSFVAIGFDPVVSMDDQGNAIIGWVNGLQIFTALLPKNGSLQAPILVVTAPDTPNLDVDEIGVALSNHSSVGFVVWLEEIAFGEGGSDAFGTTIIFAPTPPLSISARVCNNNFAMQRDRVNIISFVPSTDPSVTAYLLRRNGKLIATIPASGPFIYFDHHRNKQKTTYELTAVNSAGIESSPAFVTVN